MSKICLFCGQQLTCDTWGSIRTLTFYDCELCGRYGIDHWEKDNVDDKNKIQISSYLVYKKLHTNEPVCIVHDNRKEQTQKENPEATVVTIDEIVDQFPNRVDEKLNRALLNISKRTEYFGQIIGITSEYCPLFYAINNQEMVTIINELEQIGYFKRAGFKEAGSSYIATISVTAKGFDRIYELDKVNPTSHQAFVAMWFPDPENDKDYYVLLDNAYNKGFEAAINKAGYKPMKINKKEFLGKVDDEIIAEIKRSRFLVADFTTDCKKGQRGGVYYEAGFAHGLNIPVIYTCQQDCMKDIHFDTRQYNHIVWKDEQDLYTQLFSRIGATIGWGPQAKKEESK